MATATTKREETPALAAETPALAAETPRIATIKMEDERKPVVKIPIPECAPEKAAKFLQRALQTAVDEYKVKTVSGVIKGFA